MRLAEPERVDVTLTITMPLREWKLIRKELPRSHPHWELTNIINDAVDKVEQAFLPRTEPETIEANVETGK